MAFYLKSTDDYLIPISNRQPRTRKLNPVNRDFFKIKAREITRATSVDKNPGDPCIMFYLPDMLEPIELRNTAVIIIGRSDANTATGRNLTIDLAGHHGALLGVSRLHAKIVYRDGQYYISDLGSLNGTWVNDERVSEQDEVLLTHGDSLRLGHVVMQIGGCGMMY